MEDEKKKFFSFGAFTVYIIWGKNHPSLVCNWVKISFATFFFTSLIQILLTSKHKIVEDS
jgi:hypothetical protein